MKLAPRGHIQLRMHTGYFTDSRPVEGNSSSPADVEQQQQLQAVVAKGINLFADANVPCFFRRLSFSPDGNLLLIPTGIHRLPNAGKGLSSSSAASNTSPSSSSKSFCTHVFLRDNLTVPCVSYAGLEEPSVAVRCCPRLFKMIDHGSNNSSAPPLFAGNYRIVFAVVTINSLLIYDTQHPHPLFKLSGTHYAAINDAAWSGDANMLCVCSSDGYLTFIRFQPGALGELLEDDAVPPAVKNSFSCLYGVKYHHDLNSKTAATHAEEVAHSTEKVDEIAVIVSIEEAQEPPDAVLVAGSADPVPSPDKDAGKTLPATGGVDQEGNAAESSDAQVQSAKKRKRIQPVVIMASPTATKVSGLEESLAENTDTSNLPAALKSTPPDSLCHSSPPPSQPNIGSGSNSHKKRIAPVILSTSLSTSSANSASASSSIAL